MREEEWQAVCAHHDAGGLLCVVEQAYRDALNDHAGDRLLAIADAGQAGALLLLDWGVWKTGPPGSP